MSGLPALPADLPSVSQAKLPASYEGAKTALAECTRIDECQEWADKAEALASYAKQAQDDELRQMADRIQARAIRRCSDLLNQIRAATNQHDISGGEGALPTGRKQAARDAGLSEHRYKTAIRVGRIPETEFEEAVESDNPPTITALAEMGRQPAPPRTNHLNGRDPHDFRAATAMLGLLHHIARTSEDIDVAAAVRGLNEREFIDATGSLVDAERWITLVAQHLRR